MSETTIEKSALQHTYNQVAIPTMFQPTIANNMSWTEADNAEVEECYNKLIAEESNLKQRLELFRVAITNTIAIRSRTIFTYDPEMSTTAIPKDKWGETMTIEYRLKTKDECITKTNELLDDG
jgi:putative salt-induced outer membrane protein YdiY